MTDTSCQMETMDLRELKKRRFALLEDIHARQQELDQLDYRIDQKKRQSAFEQQMERKGKSCLCGKKQ